MPITGRLAETLEDCIFCRIIARQAPASVVAETNGALAFMDINQPTPGHVLVVPKAHVRDIYSLDAAIATEVFLLTVRVAQAVKVALATDGLDLLQANERAGQQDVFHFHMHVVARYEGDRDRIHIGWRPNLSPREELEELARTIRARLG
jgi:histidine triad (HIT) family protein